MIRPSVPSRDWPPRQPPIIAGPDPITINAVKAVLPPCVACGQGGEDTARVLRQITDDTECGYVMLCVDAPACARRYRAGRTPLQFAREVVRA